MSSQECKEWKKSALEEARENVILKLEITQLKERNEHLEQLRKDNKSQFDTGYKYGVKEASGEIAKLKEDKKKLREALTFYSGHDNEEFYSYMELRTNGVPRYVELDKDNQVKVNARDYIGKLARKVLSEITR